MDRIESSNNKIDLPKEFDGIQNKEKFLGVFEKVQSWYGEDFSGNEKKIIKDTWDRGCNEYKDGLNSTRLAILGNRIDTGIFEFRYPKFVGIDKNIIRKISDTNRQRKFREVALKIIKKYSNLFDSDIKIIETEFNKAFNAKTAPNFDTINEKISINKGLDNQNNNEGNQNLINNNNIDLPENDFDNKSLNTTSDWPPDSEIQEMLKLKISPFFEEIKKDLFKISEFSKSGNKKYIEGFFNFCANEMSSFKLDLQKDNELKYELLNIFIKHSYLISEGNERSIDDLNEEINNKIYEIHPENLEILLNDININDNVIDYTQYELTEEEKEVIDFAFNKFGKAYDKESLTKFFQKNKYYEEESIKRALTNEEKQEYEKLKEFFKQTQRLKKLEEVKHNEYIGNQEYHARNINTSIEYATGNIKDIKPIAIVENNKQISNYIYGDKDTQEKVDFNNINLSYEDKIRLFVELKEEKKTDFIFLESIKYLNDDLSINNNLVNDAGIEMQSVINNQEKIENMVKDLALKENLEKQDKEKIKEINVRRSCMVSCFRAISKFFDTVNNNGENFASEFEIKDVNENIKFDRKVITMEGTIGVNRNHVKLYYNTEDGTLEFDDFLVYNSEEDSKYYSIGNGNKKKRKISGGLPKMSEMEETAKSINSDLIGKLSLNMNQYNHIQGFAMSEAVYLKHFVGLLGSVKGEVQKFNEKNILKQDILKMIYIKFYNKDVLDEKFNNGFEVNEKREPEQFKLIKLISDSIDNYKSANQLLEFRNYINKFDELLSSKDIVKNDRILTEFFANDLSNDGDIRDKSIKIVKNESKGLSVNENDAYEYYGNTDGKSNVQGHSGLNYYEFLNLLAENKGEKRIIDLNEFKMVLRIIEKSDRNLNDNASDLFRKNYELYKNKNDLANLEVEMENAYLESELGMG